MSRVSEETKRLLAGDTSLDEAIEKQAPPPDNGDHVAFLTSFSAAKRTKKNDNTTFMVYTVGFCVLDWGGHDQYKFQHDFIGQSAGDLASFASLIAGRPVRGPEVADALEKGITDATLMVININRTPGTNNRTYINIRGVRLASA